MRGISKDDWNKKTLYPQWRVKDIFSHIIDTSIRKMSVQRDGWFDESRKPDSTEWEPLVRYITGLADEWAGATRRISPRILLSIFDVVREELHIFMKGMDPFAEAVFPVAWAGALLKEGLAKARGRRAAMNRELVRAARRFTFVSSAKAERELGYAIRPFDEMVRDTLRFAIATGRVKPESPQLRALAA